MDGSTLDVVGSVGSAIGGDLMADGDLDVTAWADLESLPVRMDELSAQYEEIFRYARTWVCQRAGFEPSPVCLLRPLAEVMDLLADLFGYVEEVGRRHWDDLHDAVVETTREVRSLDQVVADALPVVA